VPQPAPGGWLDAVVCGASGSRFETTASTTAGVRQVTVADPGDFRPGQGVMLSKCNPRLVEDHLWGPGNQYVAGSGKPLKGIVELRGYDAQAASWTVYILDVEPTATPAFRWSDDLARTWRPKVPITFDWQPIRAGLEVKFSRYEWEKGYTATFSARDQLVTTIETVEGKVLTLRDAPPKAVPDAALRHCDDGALQAVIDRAIREKRNVAVPAGYYRLAHGLTVTDATGIAIEGASGENTVLDISEGVGACFSMRNGTEVTIRNFRMVGNTGFAERDQAGHFPTWGCRGIWGQDLRTCYGTGVRGTERVLIENVHASRMSLECFWSGGPSRQGTNEPKQYTKAITYLRCSATDCGRNGFNNNDMAENTSILYCRIVDVGGCAWEGASRFVKVVGNYVRNAGTVAVGNIHSRDESFEVLPSGQHIIADNVFESVVPYGGCAIRSASGATPVVIANNLFVNFGSAAIEVSGTIGPGLPSCNTTVSGNLFDMTEIGTVSKPRHAIDVSASDTIVSNNQIYVRGATDRNVTAIRLHEPALNVSVHDNLIRNCGTGLATTRGSSRVSAVVDGATFLAAWAGVPMARRRSHLYRDWSLLWTSGSHAGSLAIIEVFDPETYRFKLKEAQGMKVGDAFDVCPPYGANWSIHSNTIAGCAQPVLLESYGSESSVFRDNLVSRGEAVGVAQAVRLAGRFAFSGNLISGFDEAGSVALSIAPDAAGRDTRNLYLRNTFERCTTVVKEARDGLWKASVVEGNLFVDCTTAPAEGGRIVTRELSR